MDIPEYEFDQATAVFMEDLDREVNLEALAIALGLEKTEYEPEQFPGLIYRPTQFEVTLLIFASGKVIIGGTSNRSEANRSIEHLKEELSVIEDV
jgi:transcription initiation factor TFIID TATA-box-binding protein